MRADELQPCHGSSVPTTTDVATIAVAVPREGIGVENDVPSAGPRQAHPIVPAGSLGEVREAHDRRHTVEIPPHEREHRVFGVVGVEPLESAGVEVATPQCRPAVGDVVESDHQIVHPAMCRLIEQVPRQRGLLGPLVPRGEFRPHEHQRRARERPLPGEEHPQRGEALALVATHLRQQTALAVYDLVVAEGQHEPFVVGVLQREGHPVVVITAVAGFDRQVLERVVHPAQVPLVAEPQPSLVHATGHSGPRGRLLGDHQRIGELLADHRGQLAEEPDRLVVLAATVGVRGPLAGPARVVEVEHRGDRIDAQRVDVELVEPVQGVRDEKVAHLVAPVVEHVRAPVGMLTALRVGVFVQRGAVEPAEAPFVAREVRRHPVDDHADSAAVEHVDESSEAVGLAETRRRREVAGHLVAPRPAERVLGDRHQFHVGETEGANVIGEFDRELLPGVDAVAPRTEVDLVHPQRSGRGDHRTPRRHPLVVAPVVIRGTGDDAGVARRLLGTAGHRVGLAAHRAIGGSDLELVPVPAACARHRRRPDPGRDIGLDRAQRRRSPVAPVADHGHRTGMRCPHRESDARHRSLGVDVERLRTEQLPQAAMRALTEQVQIELTDRAGNVDHRRTGYDSRRR